MYNNNNNHHHRLDVVGYYNLKGDCHAHCNHRTPCVITYRPITSIQSDNVMFINPHPFNIAEVANKCTYGFDPIDIVSHELRKK